MLKEVSYNETWIRTDFLLLGRSGRIIFHQLFKTRLKNKARARKGSRPPPEIR